MERARVSVRERARECARDRMVEHARKRVGERARKLVRKRVRDRAVECASPETHTRRVDLRVMHVNGLPQNISRERRTGFLASSEARSLSFKVAVI